MIGENWRRREQRKTSRKVSRERENRKVWGGDGEGGEVQEEEEKLSTGSRHMERTGRKTSQ